MMMRILFFLLYTAAAFGLDMASLPVHSIEADSVRSETGKILLNGNVKAILDLGTVTCQKAVILLDGTEKREKAFSRVIELEDHVDIRFTDGSTLQAYHGVIDCIKRVGTFMASDSQKVIYCTRMDPNDPQSDVRATSNRLVGTLVRTNDKWKLGDLNAEGAVKIEYLSKKDTP